MTGIRALIIVCASILAAGTAGPSVAGQQRDTMVIAGSPSLVGLLKALAEAYEAKHPDVRIRLYLDNGLDLRQTIAAMENSMVGQYFVGTGPIHLVAPGGDELLARLAQKNYIVEETRRTYAQEQLVLVVPESLVEAPESFEALGQSGSLRVAMADPERTQLGQQTQSVFRALGVLGALKGRVDIASDSRGVLDHVLSGEADVGVVFEHEAVKERERVRIVARADGGYQPIVHSMAMERNCPNRTLCENFLRFVQTSEAQEIVRRTGYGVPGQLQGRGNELRQ